jgi:hypothetical protein
MSSTISHQPPPAQPHEGPWIVSASRRTDLPGFHAEACAERLLRLRRPVHSVFFWTRHPAGLVGPGLLAEVVRSAVENPFVHLTLTGLGGTDLEPRAPETGAVLRLLDPLVDALRGQPERITWRFDPVLLERTSLELFEALARELGGRGVRRAIFSFPAHLSLKGPLDETYARYGLRRHGTGERLAFALRLAEAAARHGLALEACCQSKLVEASAGAIRAAACLSAELAARLHPRGLPVDATRDPRQRVHCLCAWSHDIGRYMDLCGSGCVYCYSSAGGPSPSPPGPRRMRS